MTNDEETRFRESFRVSYETTHRLSAYKDLLIEWNDKFNLVAKSTLPHIWLRHFTDSAQLMEFIPETTSILADMGAGAGFPGLVLAIMAVELKRPLKVHSIEATNKKADFLETVANTLKLPVIVRRQRVEDIKDLKADVITARALKALPELLVYANYLTKKDTICIFPKGQNLPEELTQARKYWTFAAKTHKSRSDETGSILVLSNLRYKSRR